MVLAALNGVKELSWGRWEALCPVHDDRTHPNLHIDVERDIMNRPKVKVHCKPCGANGDAVIEALGLWQHRSRIYHWENGVYLTPAKPAFVEKLPTPERVNEWCGYLRITPALWDYVVGVRGVAPSIADEFRVGYDEGRECFTLPVFDADGAVVNVRRYNAESTPKMRNLPGHGQPRLYPCPPPSDAQSVVVAEGEWDALVARSHGLTAVSGTHGAGTWAPEWSAALAGRKVTFIYDCDTAGREGAAAAAAAVAQHANVWVVDLDASRDDHYDLGDYFKNGGTVDDLRSLARGRRWGSGGAGGRRG